MSDYLTQLVTRNLDTAIVVRPRPRPLFAPEHGVAQPMVERESLLEKTTVEAPPMQPIYHSPLAPQAPLEPRQRPADQPQSSPYNISAGSLRHLEPSSPSRLIDPSTEVMRQTEIVAPRPQPEPSPLRLNEPSGDVTQRSESVAPRRQPAPVTPQPSLSPTALTQPTPATNTNDRPAPSAAASSQPLPEPSTQVVLIEQVVSSEAAPSVESPRPPTSPVVMAQPRVVPAPRHLQVEPPSPSPLDVMHSPIQSTTSPIQPTQRATPPPVGPQPAMPEPTIHVTIGRIEVRATPPPTPAAKASRVTPPVMSLDEYLRGRSGGRR